MLRAEIGTSVVVSGLVLVWMHMLALRFFWYWHFTWFDSPVHFVGGMMAAFLVAFLAILIRPGFEENKEHFALVVLFGTLIIGILWEIFEHFFNITFDPMYSFDTGLDLIMDVLGSLGAIGTIHFFRVMRTKRQKMPRQKGAVKEEIPIS